MEMSTIETSEHKVSKFRKQKIKKKAPNKSKKKEVISLKNVCDSKEKLRDSQSPLRSKISESDSLNNWQEYSPNILNSNYHKMEKIQKSHKSRSKRSSAEKGSVKKISTRKKPAEFKEKQEIAVRPAQTLNQTDSKTKINIQIPLPSQNNHHDKRKESELVTPEQEIPEEISPTFSKDYNNFGNIHSKTNRKKIRIINLNQGAGLEEKKSCTSRSRSCWSQSKGVTSSYPKSHRSSLSQKHMPSLNVHDSPKFGTSAVPAVKKDRDTHKLVKIDGKKIKSSKPDSQSPGVINIVPSKTRFKESFTDLNQEKTYDPEFESVGDTSYAQNNKYVNLKNSFDRKNNVVVFPDQKYTKYKSLSKRIKKSIKRQPLKASFDPSQGEVDNSDSYSISEFEDPTKGILEKISISKSNLVRESYEKYINNERGFRNQNSFIPNTKKVSKIHYNQVIMNKKPIGQWKRYKSSVKNKMELNQSEMSKNDKDNKKSFILGSDNNLNLAKPAFSSQNLTIEIKKDQSSIQKELIMIPQEAKSQTKSKAYIRYPTNGRNHILEINDTVLSKDKNEHPKIRNISPLVNNGKDNKSFCSHRHKVAICRTQRNHSDLRDPKRKKIGLSGKNAKNGKASMKVSPQHNGNKIDVKNTFLPPILVDPEVISGYQKEMEDNQIIISNYKNKHRRNNGLEFGRKFNIPNINLTIEDSGQLPVANAVPTKRKEHNKSYISGYKGLNGKTSIQSQIIGQKLTPKRQISPILHKNPNQKILKIVKNSKNPKNSKISEKVTFTPLNKKEFGVQNFPNFAPNPVEEKLKMLTKKSDGASGFVMTRIDHKYSKR
ncbi:unnamed protein product [Moneuplotes crassus]|uniref:Uncharacterized protein n=1 Tax=Euplotes crassus TaxID=5936 RepID=A0AAD1Y2C1_EUPCR|nr:unnamed protein product [Moneuplotes crassus]